MTTLLISGSIVIDLDDKVTFDLRSTWNPTEPEMFYNATTELYPDVQETLTIGIKRNTLSGLKSLYRLRQDIADFEMGLSETPVTLHYTASGGGRLYRTRITALSLDVPSDFFRITALNGIPNVGVTLSRTGRWIYQTITAFQTATSVYSNLVTTGVSSIASQAQTISGFSNLVVTLSGLGTAPVNSPTTLMISGLRPVNRSLNANLRGNVPNSIIAMAGRNNPAIPAIIKIPLSTLSAFGVDDSAYRNSDFTSVFNSSGVFTGRFNFELESILASGVSPFLNTYTSISTYITYRFPNETLGDRVWAVQWYDGYAPLDRTNTQASILSPKTYKTITSSGARQPQYMFAGTITRAPTQQMGLLSLVIESSTNEAFDVRVDDIFFVANTNQTRIIEIQEIDSAWNDGLLSTLTVREDFLTNDRRVYISIPGTQRPFERAIAGFGNIQTGTMSDVVDVVWIAPGISGYCYTAPIGGTGIPQRQHLRIGIQRDNATILPGLE